MIKSEDKLNYKERSEMVRKVWYEATDPYYSDDVQTFVGIDWQDLDEQEYKHDKWLGRNHPAGIRFIFKKHTIYESDCNEIEAEINAKEYERYRQSLK